MSAPGAGPVERHFVVYGFASTHDAMTAEKAIRSAGLPVTPMPPPSGLQALCGIALRVDPRHHSSAEDAMTGSGIAWTGTTDITDI